MQNIINCVISNFANKVTLLVISVNEATKFQYLSKARQPWVDLIELKSRYSREEFNQLEDKLRIGVNKNLLSIAVALENPLRLLL